MLAMKNAVHDLLVKAFTGTDTLTKQLTIDEAEVEFAVVMASVGIVPIPFGSLYPQWQQFKKKIQPSDELWEFTNMFPRGDGVRGVKLLRDGKVIDSIGAVFIPAPQVAARKKRAPTKAPGTPKKQPVAGKTTSPKAKKSTSPRKKGTSERKPIR